MPQIKCRILCIDDHEDASEMMKVLLSHEDYEVVTALTIGSALELATTSEFDLYVLDRHLPDGSGLELCQKLAQVTPGVPCIFYSGDAYAIHRSEAIAAGAQAEREPTDMPYGVRSYAAKDLEGHQWFFAQPI